MSAAAQQTNKAAALEPAAASRAPSALVQRRCACGGKAGTDGECAGCRKTRLGVQRKPDGAPAATTAPTLAPPLVHDVLSSPGQALPAAVGEAMGERLGHDFSRVRVHADRRSGESAVALGADAYTVGRHVVFAAGRYAPTTSTGADLLAHELVHVRQQAAVPDGVPSRLAVGPAGDRHEVEAERLAADGGPGPASPRVQRRLAAPAGPASAKGGAASAAGAVAGGVAGAAAAAQGPAYEPDSGATCDGTASSFLGIERRVGTFPLPVRPDFGTDFKVAERLVQTGQRRFGFHFPMLNGKVLPSGWETHGRQIHGDADPSSRRGVVVTGSGNSREAYFDPASNPPVNDAASTIVVPSTALGWAYEATTQEMQSFLDNLDPRQQVSYQGSDTDCATSSGKTQVVVGGERADLIARSEAHERRHAEDWRKVFCKVIGRRDRRIAERTGPGNARRGWALGGGKKAEERAVAKLFRGILGRQETAEVVETRRQELESRVHASDKVGFELGTVAVGKQCKAAVINVKEASKGYSGLGYTE